MRPGTLIAVRVHVGGIFAAGDTKRYDRFGRDLGEVVSIKNLGELRMYAGCV